MARRPSAVARSRRAGRWPNLFVVGAPKAGTTSLWHHLRQHPDVFMSALKEPHFFTDYTPLQHTSVKSERAYRALFAGARHETLVGEASPSYLRDPGSARAIKAACGDARIVIALREPVERAYSGYFSRVRYGERRPFEDLVRGELDEPGRNDTRGFRHLARSLYSDDVERYFEVFDGNVHVLFFEELVRDVRGELRRLYDALDVDPEVAEHVETEPLNAFSLPRSRLAGALLGSGKLRKLGRVVLPPSLRHRVEGRLLARPPKPELDPELRRVLEEYFEPDRARLERLLGRKVPWG